MMNDSTDTTLKPGLLEPRPHPDYHNALQRITVLEAENEVLKLAATRNQIGLAKAVSRLIAENEKYRKVLEYIRCESLESLAVRSADAALKECE